MGCLYISHCNNSVVDCTDISAKHWYQPHDATYSPQSGTVLTLYCTNLSRAQLSFKVVWASYTAAILTAVGAWMKLSIDWWFSRIPRPQGMLIALHRLCLELHWQVTLFRTVISASAKRSGLTQLQLSRILRSLTHLHIFCHSKLRKHMNELHLYTALFLWKQRCQHSDIPKNS